MIVVYSKDNCPNCDMAIKIAAMRKVEIDVKKLGTDFTIDELKEKFGDKTPRAFPVIEENGSLIGSIGEFKIRVLKG
ncbi:hypothetical protein [Ralstonia phage RSP15]|uniref:hypothetical protein n=1 Tax=Ralstonia phage RSP15 TaxID=1785960 RepID=UPI00074D45EA|nr:hypothetical protein BH754_gp063 [Ralstonia phage RSP15]BAU40021.1 hypothetical protein [Ralstonia phage RSP15]